MRWKKISAIYLFPNTMLAVLDIEGNQVGDLQGPYTKAKHHKLIDLSDEETVWTGFDENIQHAISNS